MLCFIKGQKVRALKGEKLGLQSKVTEMSDSGPAKTLQGSQLRGKETEEVLRLHLTDSQWKEGRCINHSVVYSMYVVAAYLVTCCWCLDQCIPFGF